MCGVTVSDSDEAIVSCPQNMGESGTAVPINLPDRHHLCNQVTEALPLSLEIVLVRTKAKAELGVKVEFLL